MDKHPSALIAGKHFTWRLYVRGGVYYADGRMRNPVNAGRHSLGTADAEAARRLLYELDEHVAVKLGLVAPPKPQEGDPRELLPIEVGQKLYMERASENEKLRGRRTSTTKRYRAVLDKFAAFAKVNGVGYWQAVNDDVLRKYDLYLVEDGYQLRTRGLENTTLKQVMKQLLPASHKISYSLEKPKKTSTYCYTPDEVKAMVTRCRQIPNLKWLGDVIIALAHTGMRISELANLRWSDLDSAMTQIHLTDERHLGTGSSARTTKNGCDRVVPIHPVLREVLCKIERRRDGRIFHGPMGGIVKPDTVRNILIREVLEPLAEQFPKREGRAKGFTDGRLHSFRHFYCTMVASSREVTRDEVMSWLGHQDSRMVRHYFHMSEDQAAKKIAKIDFVGLDAAGVAKPEST